MSMDDDNSRKRRNAKWAAAQVYDTLGLIHRHEHQIKLIVDRYKDEPSFQSRLRALGLCDAVRKRVE